MPKTRLLLADDHAIVRAGIRKVVEEMPNIEVVVETDNGLGLFETVGRYQLDCLLIDVRMPNFEPVNAIRQIRAAYPAIKILVVSAYNDDIYVQGLFGAGVDGYHLKDQPLSDLKLALERVLAGERWISGPLIHKLVTPDLPPSGAALLTMRQKDILRLLQEGRDNNAIAAEMGLSIKTVENHLTRLYRQLRVQSRLEAVAYVNQRPEVLGVSGPQLGEDAPMPAGPDVGLAKGGSILMVDDNVRYLRQLRRVLGKVCPAATLYEADSISAAVQIAQRIHPRLALVDVVLGEEDGIRCARRVKAISPQTRIITISAYPDREFHRLSLEAGAVAFLDKKDLDAVTLEQVIQDMGF